MTQLSADLMSNILTMLALAVAVVLLLLKHLPGGSARKGLKSISALPTPEGGHFLLGNVFQLLKPSMHRQLTEWANELGSLYRVRIVDKTILVLSDMELASPLLGHGPEALPKAAFAYKAVLDLGIDSTDGLFTVLDFHSSYHRTVRKILAEFFSMANIRKAVFPVACTVARQRVRAWAEAAVWTSETTSPAPLALSVSDDMMDVSLDVLLTAVFGMQLPAQDKAQFLASLKQGLYEVTLRVTNPIREPLQKLLPFLPWSKSRAAAFKQLHTMWYRVHAHIMAGAPYCADDLSMPACFWRLSEAGLTTKQMLANISPVVIGGFDTNAGTIAWALFDIASNAEVQRRLVAELGQAGLLSNPGHCPGGTAQGTSASGNSGKPEEWDHLWNLPFFNAVLKESMRLHPVAASTSAVREADRDVVIDQVLVPKGTIVWMPLTTFHTSLHNWSDPLEFRPDRWLARDTQPTGSASGAAPGPKEAFLPFSTGPRSCIGQNMANVVVRAVLLMLCSHLWFEVDPCMGSTEKVHTNQFVGLTLQCEGGINLLARPHT